MTIHMQVMYDSQDPGCEARCGLDWTNPETAAAAIRQLQHRFHEEVRLEVTDIAQAGVLAQHQALLAEVQARGWPLPVVVFNGVPRLYGSTDYRTLGEVIEVVKETDAGDL